MFWKSLFGRRIHQSPNGETVYQNLFYRWLTLDSEAIQTLINRRHPERPSLGYIVPLILPASKQPSDCCMLGLGGAGVVHALIPYMGKAKILVIEANTQVIETAKKYFMINKLPNLKITNQEAQLFVQQCNVHYQHLIVDLFDANSFPATCNNNSFFSDCYRLLFPGGILAVNLANLEEQWPIFNFIRKNFNQCTVSFPIKGTANMVILAYKGDSVTPLLNFLKQTRSLKKLSWDSKWGCVAQIT